jgi:hypothetical protein
MYLEINASLFYETFVIFVVRPHVYVQIQLTGNGADESSKCLHVVVMYANWVAHIKLFLSHKQMLNRHSSMVK